MARSKVKVKVKFTDYYIISKIYPLAVYNESWQMKYGTISKFVRAIFFDIWFSFPVT